MDSAAKIAVKTAELVDASRFGDRTAFDALVDRFRPLATRYAHSLLQDQGLAEDACQEAFVDAFLHLGQLRESAAFSGWLRRIVLKHADRQRRSRLLFVELSELPGARDPLALLIEAEAAREIHAEIADLPSRLRTAVSMFTATAIRSLRSPPSSRSRRERSRSVCSTPAARCARHCRHPNRRS